MDLQHNYDGFRQILEAASPEDAGCVLLESMQPYGLSGVVYSCPRLPVPLVVGCDAVHRWVDHFVRNNYFAVDPLYSEARKSVVAQYWQANQRRPGDTPEQVRVYREIGDFGIAQGFDFSIRDHEEEASSCFYFGPAKLDVTKTQAMVQLAALYLHERIMRLASAGSPPVAVSLSSRERECLRLVGQGLTYAQIGLKLRIAERTVTFHLQNVKKKLGVTTLAQALADQRI